MPFPRNIKPIAAARLATLLAASCLLADLSMAQQPEARSEKGPAYTEPPKDDPNYSLMGEFVGHIRERGEKKNKQQVALQIRPIAGDQFHAMAYFGGLPGQPGHETEEMRLIGLRAGDSLVLSGGPWAIFVDPEGCNLVASTGKLLGRLERVQRTSTTLGAKAPEGAVVLFDGSGVDQFVNASMTDNGLLKQGAMISPMFQDFDMHVEFRLPYMPLADGQQRGNSGLYLQSSYECQVLDSFGTEKMFNGLGSLYRMKSPDLNMSFPPLVWQTYDVRFTAPRWASDGSKVRDARVTTWINGVKVQDDVALPTKTGAGKPEAPMLSPINIQDHGDPVRFRNIWVIDRGITTSDFPVTASEEERQAAAKLEWNEPPAAPPAEAPPAEAPAAEPETLTADPNDEQPAAAAESEATVDEPASAVASEPASSQQPAGE